MGNFECNSIEDLVFSRSFRDWVLTGDSPEAGFWERWIAEHPEKQEIVQHSKALIYALRLNLRPLSEEDTEKEIRRILQKLREPLVATGDEFPSGWGSRGRRRKMILFIRSAAALVLICLAIWVGRALVRKHPADAYAAFAATHSKENKPLRQEVTGDGTGRTIDLPDGSRVTLEKNSKLYYAVDLSSPAGNREVYLTGEAFFEVRKNANRPFFVYTSSVITKVLGTSFRVEAYPSASKATVSVKTGKVSVYRKDDFYHAAAPGADPGGVVVTPNQELIYDQERNELSKILTDKPEKVTPVRNNAFVFDGTPVSQVFKTLQEAYQIPIVYDEEALSGCSLSATMGNESFYEKLNVICKAVNASYEMIDGSIIITGGGCK